MDKVLVSQILCPPVPGNQESALSPADKWTHPLVSERWTRGILSHRWLGWLISMVNISQSRILLEKSHGTGLSRPSWFVSISVGHSTK